MRERIALRPDVVLTVLVVALAFLSAWNYLHGAYGGSIAAGVGAGLTFLFLRLGRE